MSARRWDPVPELLKQGSGRRGTGLNAGRKRLQRNGRARTQGDEKPAWPGAHSPEVLSHGFLNSNLLFP